MIRRIVARVLPISVSTGVPAIGKKRIRCSGGGSGVTSSIRWSSVWLVRSLLAYHPSVLLLACVFITIEIPSWRVPGRQKKTAGQPGGFWSLWRVCLSMRLPLRPPSGARTKSTQKSGRAETWRAM